MTNNITAQVHPGSDDAGDIEIPTGEMRLEVSRSKSRRLGVRNEEDVFEALSRLGSGGDNESFKFTFGPSNIEAAWLTALAIFGALLIASLASLSGIGAIEIVKHSLIGTLGNFTASTNSTVNDANLVDDIIVSLPYRTAQYTNCWIWGATVVVNGVILIADKSQSPGITLRLQALGSMMPIAPALVFIPVMYFLLIASEISMSKYLISAICITVGFIWTMSTAYPCVLLNLKYSHHEVAKEAARVKNGGKATSAIGLALTASAPAVFINVVQLIYVGSLFPLFGLSRSNTCMGCGLWSKSGWKQTSC